MITTTLNQTRDYFPRRHDAPVVFAFNDPERYPRARPFARRTLPFPARL